MRSGRILLALAVAVLLAQPALAQAGASARAGGIITTADDASALPGVTVTFESPNLQGSRTVVSGANGAYSSPPLPPGEYTVTFSLEGFQTVVQRHRLGAGQDVTISPQMSLAAVTEEIVVTGEATQTISEDSTAAQTITFDTLESLPVARTLQQAVALAPGVNTTGPSDAITISGAQSWENLFTLNGVVINENLRGQAFDLFIEDAIQETTTQQGGISAEYGRFTGGVVTAVTKSGGNQFTGSFRTSLTNDDWQGDNDLSPDEREDSVNELFEATLGGYVVRDRLWFFGAGRDVETEGTGQTALFSVTGIEFPTGSEERRLEGKLTGAVTDSHQLQGSYLEIEENQFNIFHGAAVPGVTVDDGSLDPVRSLPQQFITGNYTGILTQNLFAEAQYSEREFTFEGSGGQDQDIITGTPIFDLGFGIAFNESIFCDGTAVPACVDEERDNEQGSVKLSYFMSTEAAGSHDLSIGGETFTDIRAADNHQSPNDLMIWNFVPSEFIGGKPFPVLTNDGSTLITHLPILNPTEGTDFQTDSVFVNDRWRLNERWSFNIGARYDTSEAVNSNGALVADSDAFSPRLGASWDIGGDGQRVVHASAGRYVGAVGNSVFDDSSPAGNPAQFSWVYVGPVPGDGVMDPITFNQTIFDWFFDVCPNTLNAGNLFEPPNLNAPCGAPLAVVDIPGGNLLLDEGLSSTSADEFTLGYQHQFGTRGRARVDFVQRDYGDFFATKRDLSTGQVTDANGNPSDLGLIINEDDTLEREYQGVSVSANFGFLNNNRLQVGGNATFSSAEGNFEGETQGSGPVASGVLEFPEYKEARWNNPTGDLAVNQEYVGRFWVIYDILRSNHHALNVSLLQNFFAGEHYSATFDLPIQQFVANPGYVNPPTTVTYFVSDRGEFTTDDITRTDLALNYSFNVGRFEVFVQPEMLNVFNEDGSVSENATVSLLEPFNPFTTTPVEGVHYEFGSNFGNPTSEASVQDPRTWRVSVGLRFNP